MTKLLGYLTGALVSVAALPGITAAQVDCVEECKRLNPGFGCVPGDQGENCTAGVNYCMIDNCEDPPEPEGLRAADGVRYYAVLPCDGPPVIIPARIVAVVIDRTATGPRVRIPSSQSTFHATPTDACAQS